MELVSFESLVEQYTPIRKKLHPAHESLLFVYYVAYSVKRIESQSK
ncbi:hypothetical protein [Niallia sp. 01092]